MVLLKIVVSDLNLNDLAKKKQLNHCEYIGY